MQKLFQHELIQDPGDIVANYLIQASQDISMSTLLFASTYLIIHGSIKFGLFLGLWHKKLWIYPLAWIVLSLFAAYQVVRFFNTHSIVLLFLIFIDISIIILLRFEYKRLTRSDK